MIVFVEFESIYSLEFIENNINCSDILDRITELQGIPKDALSLSFEGKLVNVLSFL